MKEQHCIKNSFTLLPNTGYLHDEAAMLMQLWRYCIKKL